MKTMKKAPKETVKSAKKLRSGKGRSAVDRQWDLAMQDKGPKDEVILQGWKLRLQQIINQRDTNVRRVSIESGLAPTTVRNMLFTQRSAGIDVITAICDHLQISLQWLITGDGRPDLEKSELERGVQSVPVIAWGDIASYIKRGNVEAMRHEQADAITPPDGRFRLDFSGRSMTGLIEDGDILDCSGAMRPEPEEVVVAWSAKQKKFLVRRVMPKAFGETGEIIEATLVSTGPTWPDVPFSTEAGDRLLAVVFNVIRPLRRTRRGGT